MTLYVPFIVPSVGLSLIAVCLEVKLLTAAELVAESPEMGHSIQVYVDSGTAAAESFSTVSETT